jgi:hypothetical protein
LSANQDNYRYGERQQPYRYRSAFHYQLPYSAADRSVTSDIPQAWQQKIDHLRDFGA